MTVSFYRLLDEWIIRFAAARLSGPCVADPHFDQAERLPDQPGFFGGNVGPAELEFAGPHVFRFRSAVVTPYAENNMAHGKFHPCAARWQDKPTVILMHGWNDFGNHYFRFPQLQRQFNRAGINCARLQLPYHFQRKPAAPDAVRNFISGDLLRMIEATQQAMADIWALKGWLMKQGNAKVGLWGVSLGGWLSGLVACHDPSLAFAVLLTPVARMDRMVKEIAFCEPVRRSLQGRTFDFARLNLTAHHPQIAKDKILLIEAENDLFLPKETIEELWQAWDQPEIWRTPHGHVSISTFSGALTRTIEWVRQKTA